MEYNFREIEKRWQDEWRKNKTYHVENGGDKPKFYVLDMFPYPSGAGLHVGHPLGYIASDIVARYKRLCGYNVLHPMGYDAFGLPAEQYAIQTGRHPADTTKENIARYREQLDKIGFSFDWDREVQTCDPKYYKWTQWIFIQLFKSWYNHKTDRAESIDTLIAVFETEGFRGDDHRTLTGDVEHDVHPFTAEQWKNFSEKEKSDVLMNFRLAYLGEAWVNWCPQLGTVLANDEVKDGVSERGGYPVERKRMPQWSMRITAYADRLLKDLDTLDWSESIKEAQRNWIGRSEGTSIVFQVASSVTSSVVEKSTEVIEVFTTRPDTIFGVTFVTLAPEHELVDKITTAEYKVAVAAYVNVAKNKSERERQAEKKVSGQFTGAYVVHPFTNEKVPVYIGEYVLAGYGTGAVMAVPAHDSRDFAFAKHFNLGIPQVVTAPADHDFSKESYDAKDGICINSDFLNGLEVKDAVRKAIEEIEKRGIGKGKVNFRLRDAAFGRQRYWGEPIPVYYKDGVPMTMDESDLPLVLPEIDKFLPTETGEPPLARAKNWFYSPATPQPLSTGEGRDLDEDLDSLIVAESFHAYRTGNKEAWELLKARGRENRKEPTPAEDMLWQALRKKSTGHHIRRQHAIDIFIADFACIRKRVVIEVDGGYHSTPEQIEADNKRTFILEQAGFEVMRFTNDRVMADVASVVNEIKKKLDSLPDYNPVFSSGTTGGTALPFGELGGARDAGDKNSGGERYPLETTTMPGWAGSSWYFLRYMDPNNDKELVSKSVADYWGKVDLYLGGAEHATGHLLYVRVWTKFLFDIGKISINEPAQKLVNQGMIQGMSSIIYRLALVSHIGGDEGEHLNQKDVPSIFVTKEIGDAINDAWENGNQAPRFEDVDRIVEQLTEKARAANPKAVGQFQVEFAVKKHVPIEFVKNNVLDVAQYKAHGDRESKDAIYILRNDKFECLSEVEKMSKRWLNVVNPDDICNDYGADTLRLYEMFLGPLEQHKPWSTNGISGTHNFLKRFFRLFQKDDAVNVSNDAPTEAELKVLHRTLKKVADDIERMSFNTCVSTFMIALNELSELKCNKRAVLEPLVIALSPFAPHIAEELWSQLGNKGSVTVASFPKVDEKYLVDNTVNYPVQFNGKMRFTIALAADMSPKDIEKEVLASADAQKYLEGKTPKKVIVVPKKIVNVVL